MGILPQRLEQGQSPRVPEGGLEVPPALVDRGEVGQGPVVQQSQPLLVDANPLVVHAGQQISPVQLDRLGQRDGGRSAQGTASGRILEWLYRRLEDLNVKPVVGAGIEPDGIGSSEEKGVRHPRSREERLDLPQRLTEAAAGLIVGHVRPEHPRQEIAAELAVPVEYEEGEERSPGTRRNPRKDPPLALDEQAPQ